MTFQVFPWLLEPRQGTPDGWPKNEIGSDLGPERLIDCVTARV